MTKQSENENVTNRRRAEIANEAGADIFIRLHGDSATYIGAKQGALTGSIFCHVPALTIEMIVLTNASDEAFIKTEAGQSAMVEALKAGLEYYFRSL